MLKARLIALRGVAALALAGSVQAAVVEAQPVPAMQRPGIVAARTMGGMAVPDAAAGASDLVQSGPEPAVLMTAVLGAGPAVEARWSTQARQAPAAVPLPGALWLFGCALVVFVGIAARRSF